MDEMIFRLVPATGRLLDQPWPEVQREARRRLARPKTFNPETLNPKTLNPKTLNPKTFK